MILGFIPMELVRAIGGAVLALLINNVLGMYNASQWEKFDKQAAIDGNAWSPTDYPQGWKLI